MKTIDLKSWPRRKHFETYRLMDHPHFNMTATIEVDKLLQASRQQTSLTVAITYLLSLTANGIENFRWRIRGDQVVEHEVVHPSITILTPDDLFSFCTIPFLDDYLEFSQVAAEKIHHVQEEPTLEDGEQEDELLYMTSIPWVSFTSFMHPMHFSPVDSVPRLSWGKIHELEGQKVMPLSVQGHHALMDGLHVGLFYAQMQDNCDQAEFIFNT